MRTRLTFLIFGLAVAGLTVGASIFAATHEEEAARVRSFALQAVGMHEDTEVSATSDTNTVLQTSDSDTHEPSLSESKEESRSKSSTSVKRTHTEDLDEDDEQEEGDDDRGEAARGAQTTPTAPTSSAQTAGTPSIPAQTFTLTQIATHHTSADCYTAISGGVYNLTPFITAHPGGVSAISALCGIDGTNIFMAQHGGQGKPETELASLKIGVLVK